MKPSFELESINLSNIAGGCADDLFAMAFKKVLGNIQDLNTEITTERKITLEFAFKPHEDRSGAKTSVKCKTKLADPEAIVSNMFVVREQGTVKAYHTPSHPDLFEKKETK